MARRFKLAAGVALVVLAIPAGRWMRHARPWESAKARAHRLCGECGLEPDEIHGMIDEFSHPTLRRGQAIELFYDTFDDDDSGPRSCEPCAEAVFDAADRFERS